MKKFFFLLKDFIGQYGDGPGKIEWGIRNKTKDISTDGRCPTCAGEMPNF